MTTPDTGDPTSRPRWRLSLAVGGVALAVAATCGQWALTVAFDLPRGYAISAPLTGVVLAVVGALVLVRGRGQRHGYGVLVLLTGVLYATQGLAEAWVDLAWMARPDVEWPFALAAAWYQDTWMLLQMLLFLLLPALFPDGRPASPGWARAVRVTTAAWLAVIVAFLTMDRPLTGLFEDHPEITVPNPVGLWPETTLDAPEIIGIPWLAVSFVSMVIGIGSLVSRWRRDEGVVRPQFVVVGAGFFVLLVTTAIAGLNILLVEVMGVDLGLTGPLTLAFGLATVVCAVAFGVAVLRYRLFEVDLVVNRTIVYGLLTLGVVVTYAVLVIGVGAVLPGASDQGLALAATGAVAVAFDPARRRLQRHVNRVVFGLRDEPYELLAHLGEVVASTGSPDDGLRTLVDTVATSLKLPWVAIELDQRDGQVVRAEHGSREAVRGVIVSVPIMHRDQEVGRLQTGPRTAGEALRPADRQLLADVARQAGALAATARLTMDLQRSRERLVQAREEERRRVRRDLHGGLGPSLAAQALGLDEALDLVDDEPAQAHDRLVLLRRETQQRVAEIRRIVYDLRPPALDELGLAGALMAHVGQVDGAGSVAVRIHTAPDPLPELSAAVDVAAWRITREAITNVVRHADASRCNVQLAMRDDALAVEVDDDGLGLPAVPREGGGLQSMRDRAEELGGTFAVAAGPAGGTVVTATLPIIATPGQPTARHPLGVPAATVGVGATGATDPTGGAP